MYHSLPLFPSFPCLVPRNKLPPTPEKTQRAATQKKNGSAGANILSAQSTQSHTSCSPFHRPPGPTQFQFGRTSSGQAGKTRLFDISISNREHELSRSLPPSRFNETPRARWLAAHCRMRRSIGAEYARDERPLCHLSLSSGFLESVQNKRGNEVLRRVYTRVRRAS